MYNSIIHDVLKFYTDVIYNNEVIYKIVENIYKYNRINIGE